MRWLFLSVWIVFSCVGNPAIAATFTNTPSAISDTYAGMITLQIGGLTNGETVVVEKILDADTNGVIDASDMLMQSFRLTDNQTSIIGGVTNINVPCDLDSSTGAITAQLNFYMSNVEHIAGKYAFKLSSPTGRFTAITNSFVITNFNFSQSFTGAVKSGAATLPNAVVVLMTPEEGKFVAGTVANNSGNYAIAVAPGTYFLAAFKSNYVCNFATAPVLTLNSGATIATNLALVAATRSISGKLADAANTNSGLPGMPISASSTDNYGAFSTTDNNGNFNLRVTAGQWKVKASAQLSSLGFLGVQPWPIANTSGGNVSGFFVLVPKATALVYGTVKDNLNNLLPGVDFLGENILHQYDLDVTSDDNGRYVAPLKAGTWNIGVEAVPGVTNYTVNSYNVSISDGQAVRHDFVVCSQVQIATTNLPVGQVGSAYEGVIEASTCQWPLTWTLSPGSSPLPPGLTLFSNPNWGLINGTPTTAGSNYISIRVTDGVNHTADRGFPLVINFAPLQVETFSLPGGTNGMFYSQQLNASGGQPPYSWLLAPGSASLPANLSISTNGVISGVPNTNGTFYFYVRVTDSMLNNADSELLSLTISPAPLQVTNTSLPNGTVGVAYNAQLGATGGQQPYTWSLAPGSASLPANLSLDANGLISGIPAASGTNAFIVRVTDAYLAFTNRTLNIIVNSKPILSSPTRISASQFQFQVNGAAGTAYTIEATTNLPAGLPNWFTLFVTNAPANSFIVVDPSATNNRRFYRAVVP